MRMSLWAGVFVTLLAASIAVDQGIRTRLQELEDAQHLFTEAISQTKNDLLIKVGEVASDSTIPQHLTWGLAHSVRSTLESHIASGKLDQVTLWTKGGTETGRARDIQVKRPFEPGEADKAVDRWTWSQEGSTPELSIFRPLVGSSAHIYVTGSVSLGKTWLERFPHLQKKIDQFDLRVAQAAFDGISIKPIDKNQTSPKLISLRTSDRWILAIHRKWGANIIPSTWPSFILAVAFALAALSKTKKKFALLEKQASSHLQWCEELSGERIFDEFTTNKSFDASIAKRHIERALALKNSAHQDLQEKIVGLEAQIQRMDDDLKRRQKQLLSIAPFQSMAVQVLALIDPFLNQLDDFHQGTLNAAMMLQKRVAVSSQNLTQVLQRWTSDWKARGSRKFIRSLAETPGKEPNSTALDDDIALIERTSLELMGSGEKTVAYMAYLTEKAAGLKACAERWDSMREQSFAPEEATLPFQVLKEAQDMLAILMESRGQKIEFLNHPSHTPDLGLPPSPQQVWVAAIFHLLQAFFLFRTDAHCKISCRIRTHGDRGLMVFQGRKTESSSPQKSEQGLTATDLMELARTLLSPYDTSLQALPQKDPSVLALAVVWPWKPNQTKKDDRIAAGHPIRGLTNQDISQ